MTPAVQQRLNELVHARAVAHQQIVRILTRDAHTTGLNRDAEITLHDAEGWRLAAITHWRDHPTTLAARQRVLDELTPRKKAAA
jgi:hypothetical protein